MKRFLMRLTVLFLSSVLTLSIAEFVLSRSSLIDSTFGQHRYSETRAFEQTPGYKGRDKLGNSVVINSRGLRDEEYPLHKPKGVYRILVLGDSVTFGFNVAAEDSFPEQLQRILNEGQRSRKVEVLNAGVSGYNTYQELVMLKEVGLSYDPDLVILCYTFNDPVPFSKQGGLIDPKHKRLIAAKELIQAHTPYLYALVRRLISLGDWYAEHPAVKGNFLLEAIEEDSPGWNASYTSLEEIQRVTAARGVKFALAVVAPLSTGLKAGETYSEVYQQVHDRILNAGRELGIDTIDLLPAWKGHDPADLKIFDNDIWHPNAEGHRLIAEKLSEHIRSTYLGGDVDS